MEEISFEQVRSLLCEVLGLEGREAELDGDSPLLGAIPEFDSLAVMELLTALERRFGIAIDDQEIDADDFLTLGRLYRFVLERQRQAG